MTTPVVIELPRRIEPTTADDFAHAYAAQVDAPHPEPPRHRSSTELVGGTPAQRR